MTAEEIRSELQTTAGAAGHDSFTVLQALCTLVNQVSGKYDDDVQELVLLALEQRDRFAGYSPMLDGLVRSVGLFPYLDPKALMPRDRVAYEVHRPENLAGVVFHRPQARVYWSVLNGENVVLSAPTSFGKSLIIDAVIASGKFKNILIVVPTIALIDETRRRMADRFRDRYKVITHIWQKREDRNIVVLTQERVLELESFEEFDFFVVDEFYKLSPSASSDDDRCTRLNDVFYRMVKTGKQFYMLGPNVSGMTQGFDVRVEYRSFFEPYKTVVSQLHDMRGSGDEWQRLKDLCQTLKEPTLIFCSSPNRASRVAQELISAGVGRSSAETRLAADWIAETYHPNWHFAQALRRGIGIHHGRVPRALAQYVVRSFNNGSIRFLVCTSTLIEGVNTKAKNIVIFDNTIDRSQIDLFTFNNIRGRSGRMGQHFVGNVYLFHAPPEDELPFVDVPVFSQGADTPEELLLQIDKDDLTPTSKQRIEPYERQSMLSVETLRKNAIDPDQQLRFAADLMQHPGRFLATLQWSGIPSFAQVYGMADIMFRYFDARRLGHGSVLTPKQLGFLVNSLRSTPTISESIQQAYTFYRDADKAVQSVLDFLRLWAMFHFPRLLRAIGRIQEEILPRLGFTKGNYDFFASKVENLFLNPEIVALEEYGVPLETAVAIASQLQPDGDLDAVLGRLKALNPQSCDISQFERSLVADAQRHL